MGRAGQAPVRALCNLLAQHVSGGATGPKAEGDWVEPALQQPWQARAAELVPLIPIAAPTMSRKAKQTESLVLERMGTTLSPALREPSKQAVRKANRLRGYKRYNWNLAHIHWVFILLWGTCKQVISSTSHRATRMHLAELPCG